MDPIFSVQRKSETLNLLENTSFVVSCTISNSGIVAFSTCVDLLEGTKVEKFGYFVYVADINAPWRIYNVSAFRQSVTALEFDSTGRILLTADGFGDIKLWMMKDFLISSWHQVAEASFPGENIIAAQFFHKGRKIQYVNDKLELTSYLEKFSRVKFHASVRRLGGVGADGCIFVTSTGMLGAFQFPAEGFQNQTEVVKLETVTESLGLTRNFFTCADIAYGKRQFMIAVVNGRASSPVVQGYRVLVELQGDKLSISSSSLPSFFVQEGAGTSLMGTSLSRIQWSTKEDPDMLLVGLNHSSGTLIESWKLKEQSKPLKKLFQVNKNEALKTIVWTPLTSFHHNSHTNCFTVSPAPSGPACVYVNTSDGLIHCLKLETLKEVCKVSLTQPPEDGAKQARVSPIRVKCLTTTPMGHLLLVCDHLGGLHAYRCSFMLREPSQYMNGYPAYIASSLEYSMINGNDFLDILLNIRPQTYDAIVEKLNENFNRQHNIVQQYYYVNYLVTKINIYRLSSQGQTKAQDLNNLLMLHSILIAFKSLLRPSDLTSHEGPAEKLALALSESVPDVDKVLLNLEAKDFTVEMVILQSLKQLIQWVADLALNILARIPENHRLGKPPTLGGSGSGGGYDISRDIVALNSIRELLVMIRIWGLFKPQCLPSFTRSSDNSDILSTIFRLLTKLALNPNEPDDILIDECCALPSLVVIPSQISYNAPRTGLLSPTFQSLSLPLSLEYGCECEALNFQPEMAVGSAVAELGSMGSESAIDAVRYLQFGKWPKSLRKCTRCGAYTSLNSIARTSATKAWEQRWINGCRCGGFWRLVDE